MKKEEVVAILRSVLLSDCTKDGVTLSKLNADFCEITGAKEIPIFEYRNLGHYLESTEEFLLSIVNGTVMVGEKPKAESRHIKKFVDEQRSSGRRTSTSGARKKVSHVCDQRKSVRKSIPNQSKERKPIELRNSHHGKPTTVYTFDDMKRQLPNLATLLNPSDTHLKNDSEPVPTDCVSPAPRIKRHDEKQTISFTIEDLKRRECLTTRIMDFGAVKSRESVPMKTPHDSQPTISFDFEIFKRPAE